MNESKRIDLKKFANCMNICRTKKEIINCAAEFLDLDSWEKFNLGKQSTEGIKLKALRLAENRNALGAISREARKWAKGDTNELL